MAERDYFRLGDVPKRPYYQLPEDVRDELHGVSFPIVPRNGDAPVPGELEGIVSGAHSEQVIDTVAVATPDLVGALREMNRFAAAAFFRRYNGGGLVLFNARDGGMVPPGALSAGDKG